MILMAQRRNVNNHRHRNRCQLFFYHLGPAKARFPRLVSPTAHMPLGRLETSMAVSFWVLTYPCISKTPSRAPSSSGSSSTKELILSVLGKGTLRSAIAFMILKSIVSNCLSPQVNQSVTLL